MQQIMIMQVLKAGTFYFGIIFGAGFVLGTVRTLWVIPRIDTRTAELLETPIMLVLVILGARWTVQRLAVPSASSTRLAMGGIALCLMLFAEFGFMLWLRGLSIKEYLATLDPVAGMVYYSMLVVFAAMPLLVTRGSQ